MKLLGRENRGRGRRRAEDVGAGKTGDRARGAREGGQPCARGVVEGEGRPLLSASGGAVGRGGGNREQSHWM